ncbi:hypothetical protein [Bacillus vallismortis]|uniref:hypothetical protein n=1 Tax=Bacillus vallismortis TaxID=72361 RepID=UPI00227E9293|nr:hypothetical protein [Bacillus vallismortis]MCY8310015.1 hypothetical protein [Bacillus vallismortis]MCY8598957.1 hypothetical protein [Bacillus vallismortis]
MKLEVERWLEKQNFSREITNLFEESITCYKASAYRASLLFSYLGFQSIIKERILKSEKPNNIKEGQWETIKRKLRNDDSWDNEVRDCIKRNNENTILFNITDDLRQQAAYWTYRRNDCAHSKPNTISYSHVESFWLFLFSNLSKFVVEGGVNALLQKIDKYFDLNFTSEKSNFSNLIDEVPFAVNVEEMDYFLNELESIFYKQDTDYPFAYSERIISFLSELIKLESSYSEKIIEFIKRDELTLEESILGTHPEHITLFYNDKEGVRNFWRTKLPYMESHKFTIFAALLRNNLIDNEKEEAIDFFIEHISAKRNSLFPELIEELKFHGYFERYKKLVFLEGRINDFDWANKEGRNTIVDHLNILGLDQEIVESINKTFDYANYPYKMRNELKEYFLNPQKNQEYRMISESLGIKPTNTLGF